MTVYIVICAGDYGCHDEVLGVFDSRLKAETFINTARHRYHGETEYFMIKDCAWIDQLEVK